MTFADGESNSTFLQPRIFPLVHFTRLNAIDPVILLQHLESFQIVLAIFYSVVFIFGATGNVYVISVVTYVLRTLRGQTVSFQTRHVFVYVLSLSVVDLCVILTIPFLLTDLILTTWIYGEAACRVFVVVENLNKWLSILILTALGADRFLAIQFPTKCHRFRTPKLALLVMFLCFALVACCMSPLPFWTELVTVPYNASFSSDNKTIYGISLTRCNFHPPAQLHRMFAISTFSICYCLPALSIAIFYVGILRVVYIHDHHSSAASIPFRRVLRYILLVTSFYFICWSPYWFFAVLFQLIFHIPYDAPYLNAISYMCHLLPYVSCAVNPILYALLNRELRHSHTLAIRHNSSRAKRREANNSPQTPQTSCSHTATSRPFHSVASHAAVKNLSLRPTNRIIQNSNRSWTRWTTGVNRNRRVINQQLVERNNNRQSEALIHEKLSNGTMDSFSCHPRNNSQDITEL